MAAVMQEPVRHSVQIATELIATHCLIKRWAYGERERGHTLHPLEAIRLLHDGAVFGGSDAPEPAEIEICAQVIKTSPESTQYFIKLWYQDGSPVHIKAARLGIHRSTIYIELKGHLQYIRGRLHGRGVMV
jgi:hypothetical protein